MGHGSFIAKNIFKKIFKNLAEEVEKKTEDIMIGICYENGAHKYVAYIKKDDGSFTLVLDEDGKTKNIKLEDYLGIIDQSIAMGTVDSTIGQGGPRFAKELTEKLQREIKVDDISILMKYKKDDLPQAVLMTGTEKHRAINIEAEFLQG